MAIRRQVSVSDEVWGQLRALEFVTKQSHGALVGRALRVLLEGDPALASKVEAAKKVAA